MARSGFLSQAARETAAPWHRLEGLTRFLLGAVRPAPEIPKGCNGDRRAYQRADTAAGWASLRHVLLPRIRGRPFAERARLTDDESVADLAAFEINRDLQAESAAAEKRARVAAAIKQRQLSIVYQAIWNVQDQRPVARPMPLESALKLCDQEAAPALRFA
jgi:hypothetical protein